MSVRRAALLGLLLPCACHRSDGGAAAVDAAPAAPPAQEAPAALFELAPARCKSVGVALAVDDGHGLDDLEIGDTLTYARGIAVDLVHRAASGRTAAVALLPPDASSVRVRDLGPTLGDAPPPRLAARGDGLLAVAYGVSHRGDARELVVYTLSAGGDVKATGTLAEPRDDSLAFDLAGSLLAWDEATSGPKPHGVIRVAEVGADGRAGAPRDASPAGSDAEAPRLLPIGAGTFLFWIARRPDAAAVADASPVEITGEAPATSWLEVQPLDAHGGPAGPVRRLTSAMGHVSAFDVQALPGANGALAVVRDDGEAVDGSGGALLRVRVRDIGSEPAVAYPTDGLGRGAPSLVDASPPWLAWVAPREEARLLPLDAAGVPAARASVEPQLDEGRPLAVLGPGPRILVATPADPSAQLRVLSCSL